MYALFTEHTYKLSVQNHYNFLIALYNKVYILRGYITLDAIKDLSLWTYIGLPVSLFSFKNKSQTYSGLYPELKAVTT